MSDLLTFSICNELHLIFFNEIKNKFQITNHFKLSDYREPIRPHLWARPSTLFSVSFLTHLASYYTLLVLNKRNISKASSSQLNLHFHVLISELPWYKTPCSTGASYKAAKDLLYSWKELSTLPRHVSTCISSVLNGWTP